MRIIPKELSLPLHADAAAAIGMIHENQFAAIGVRLFERGEFFRFGAERFVFGDNGAPTENEERKTGNKEAIHSVITLLLSPNWSVSTPMRCAMRRSRLLM